MATRVTLPASRFAPEQEARHGQPPVTADVRQTNENIPSHRRLFVGFVCRVGASFVYCHIGHRNQLVSGLFPIHERKPDEYGTWECICRANHWSVGFPSRLPHYLSDPFCQ